MTTMTAKDLTHAVGDPLTRMDFEPSIPRFMEAAGVCSVLVRNYGDFGWDERWVNTSGFVTEAIEASDIEVERYLSLHDADDLLFVDDLPEPISCHDADLWDSCNEDLNDYEVLALQYENAHAMVA